MNIMLQSADVTIKDSGRIIGVSSDERAGYRGIGCSTMPGWDSADIPSADHLVESPRNAVCERATAPERQGVGEGAVQIMGGVEIGIAAAETGAYRVADEAVS